jgi:dTDP-glucose 4,6-dehydratase/UDP-glucuronate decarboxylase
MTSRTTTIVEEDVAVILDDLTTPLAKLHGSTLLVTGASGFLCSWFVETVAALNDQGVGEPCRVIAVDNHVTGQADRLARIGGDWLRLVEHDVTHPLDLGEPVDWVINGASIASPTTYRRFPLETIDVNVTGTRNALELARTHDSRGVLHISSSEIYGDPDPAFVPTSEEYVGRVSCTGPRACYDESKRLSETLCMTYRRLYDVPVKIVRPFNVYGPGQRLDDGRIMPDILGSLVRREPISLFSNGEATRAFCYVTDAIRAMWHVLLSDVAVEIFNVGNDLDEVAIAELAAQAAVLGGPPSLPVVHAASHDSDYVSDNPQRRCPDLTKLRSTFPWVPRVPLLTGIERAYRSYLEAA